jgi:hypothetical protein
MTSELTIPLTQDEIEHCVDNPLNLDLTRRLAFQLLATMQREMNLRQTVEFILDSTAHDGKTGNEYRFPSVIRLHEVCKEALAVR